MNDGQKWEWVMDGSMMHAGKDTQSQVAHTVGGFQPTVKRPKAFPVHRDNLDHNEMKAMLKEDERNFKDAVDAFIEKSESTKKSVRRSCPSSLSRNSSDRSSVASSLAPRNILGYDMSREAERLSGMSSNSSRAPYEALPVRDVSWSPSWADESESGRGSKTSRAHPRYPMTTGSQSARELRYKPHKPSLFAPVVEFSRAADRRANKAKNQQNQISNRDPEPDTQPDMWCGHSADTHRFDAKVVLLRNDEAHPRNAGECSRFASQRVGSKYSSRDDYLVRLDRVGYDRGSKNATKVNAKP